MIGGMIIYQTIMELLCASRVMNRSGKIEHISRIAYALAGYSPALPGMLCHELLSISMPKHCKNHAWGKCALICLANHASVAKALPPFVIVD
jgi:hypothetical protein